MRMMGFFPRKMMHSSLMPTVAATSPTLLSQPYALNLAPNLMQPAAFLFLLSQSLKAPASSSCSELSTHMSNCYHIVFPMPAVAVLTGVLPTSDALLVVLGSLKVSLV